MCERYKVSKISYKVTGNDRGCPVMFDSGNAGKCCGQI
jgi:hypothetical protein